MKRLFKRIVLKVYFLYLLGVVSIARLQKKTLVFILGTPLHANLGDQAITLAEVEFIQTYISNVAVVTIPKQFISQERVNMLPGLVRQEDIIVGHGGGNMGDVYMSEELCRRKFVELFPQNKIIIFPQTIHFTDTKLGKSELAKSKSVYSKHKHLTLIARERTSYKVMRHTFVKNDVLLTPDIVLSTNKSKPVRERSGLLLCFRHDKEAKLNQEDKQTIDSFSSKYFKAVRQTDTVSKKSFFFLRSKSVAVQSKLEEFRAAEFVITDRLHGMVFAAITGTPCIAMANFNHKVADTYAWISYLPYIKFCKHTSELEALFEELNLGKAYKYTPGHFSDSWAMIKKLLVGDVK